MHHRTRFVLPQHLPSVRTRTALLLLLAFLELSCFAACSRSQMPKPRLEPVAALDMPRYMGRWYEIAALPNPFQKNCFGTYADYELTAKGDIAVHNSCHKGSLEGPLQGVQGRAWRPDAQVPAALKVQFFWPFSGDYWVLALDPDYRWAVVGQPKRTYLWILSRTPTLDADTLEALCRRLPEWGYDAGRLHRTAQMPGA